MSEAQTTKDELAEYVKSLPKGQADWWYFAMQIQWLCDKIDEIKKVPYDTPF